MVKGTFSFCVCQTAVYFRTGTVPHSIVLQPREDVLISSFLQQNAKNILPVAQKVQTQTEKGNYSMSGSISIYPSIIFIFCLQSPDIILKN